jgi:hypothetical protein
VDGLCDSAVPGVKSFSSPSGTREAVLPEIGAGEFSVVVAIVSEAWRSLIVLVYLVSSLG